MSKPKRPDIDYLRETQPNVIDQYICAIMSRQILDGGSGGVGSGREYEDLDMMAKHAVYLASRLVTYRYNLDLAWIEQQMQEPVEESKNE
ncbi:MAG: hypothetical protein OES34_13160 [Nitrosopumilus sp.]|nr:hypothetical protein [Nitrosopumilus sp.]